MRQMRENVLRKLACKQAFSTDAIWRSATSRWRMLRIRNRDACWTGIMSVSSLKNHWSLNCSLLLFRFELRSLPWTPLADITRFRIRILNWIERSRLFCYSVINLLFALPKKAFIFYHIVLNLSRTFFIPFFKFFLKTLFFISSFREQLLYYITLLKFVKNFFEIFLQNSFISLSKLFSSCATKSIISQCSMCVKHFFDIFCNAIFSMNFLPF